tara:strand:+ start:330 stop:1055 length:726 start_codon:yes stop_codon:yes gene_type:complete
MEVILIKDLKRKGTFGDVIEVADGYARNFLIPNGFALAANNANKKRFEEIKGKAFENVNKLRDELSATCKEIKDKTFTIVALSRDGKLYGSITPLIIANRIKEDHPDVKINGSDILIEDGQIKFVGSYVCRVQFTKDIFSNFTLVIEADESDEQPELLEAILEEDEQAAAEAAEQYAQQDSDEVSDSDDSESTGAEDITDEAAEAVTTEETTEEPVAEETPTAEKAITEEPADDADSDKDS